jgi:hypothetical protein
MLHSLKQQDLSKKPQSTFYGAYGEVLQNEVGSLAKSVKGSKSTKYYCKFNTTGVEAGHLVNPWSIFSDDNILIAISKDVVNKRTGKPYFEYQEVGQELFSLYVRFLETHSDVHYRQAERLAIEDGY